IFPLIYNDLPCFGYLAGLIWWGYHTGIDAEHGNEKKNRIFNGAAMSKKIRFFQKIGFLTE
ncbi:MAG: hypothetical protein ABFS56_28615, partial [Pseudomonadota bacterium]